MSNNIDYDKYLAELGKVETDQKQIIKKYLEEQCEKDEALKALYRPEKLDGCYDFIYKAVSKMQRQGQIACLEHSVVFKMARDYFIEILPKVAEEPPKVSSALDKAAEDKGAETAAEARIKAEPENEKPIDDAITNQDAGEKESEGTEQKTAETESETKKENQKENENAIVTDEYGFEVFGEEPQKEEELCEDWFIYCERFEPGDVLDKKGARLKSKDLFTGLKFVHEDLAVCKILEIDGGSVKFQNANGFRLTSLAVYIDAENPVQHMVMYAIPEDAVKTGYMLNGKVKELSDEEIRTDYSTDEDGNGLLFGI